MIEWFGKKISVFGKNSLCPLINSITAVLKGWLWHQITHEGFGNTITVYEVAIATLFGTPIAMKL